MSTLSTSRTKILLGSILFAGFFIHLASTLWTYKRFNEYEPPKERGGKIETLHRMIKGDSLSYYYQAVKLVQSIRAGESNIITAGEFYRSSYLHPRWVAVFLSLKNPLPDANHPPLDLGMGFFLFQSILFLLSLAFLFSPLKHFMGEKLALLFVFLSVIEVSTMQFCVSYWSESIFLSLLGFAVGLFLRLFMPGARVLHAAGLGLLLVTMFLQRAVAVMFPLLLLPTAYLFLRKKLGDPKHLVISGLIYVLGLTGMGLLNQHRFGVFLIAPTQNRDTVFQYYANRILYEKSGLARDTQNDSSFQIIASRLKEKSELTPEEITLVSKGDIETLPWAKKDIAYAEVLKFTREVILSHPIEAASLWIRNTARQLFLNPYYIYCYFLFDYKKDPAAEKAFFKSVFWSRIFYSLLIYLPAFFGVLLFVRKNRSPVGWLFIINAIYLTAFTSWCGDVRFNLHCMPTYLFFWSYFASEGFPLFRLKNTKTAMPIAAAQ